MKCAFIERHRHRWPISLACEVLGVSPSGYHERKAREIDNTSRPRRNISNDALLVHIRAVHAESKGEYGWPRVWKELLARGIRVGKERVQKLMKLHGIKARSKRKYKATTDSNHRMPVAQDCCSVTSPRRCRIACGAATSPTSPPTKDGCTWLW